MTQMKGSRQKKGGVQRQMFGLRESVGEGEQEGSPDVRASPSDPLREEPWAGARRTDFGQLSRWRQGA